MELPLGKGPGILSRAQREKLSSLFIGFAIFGVVASTALAAVGFPLWFAILPVIPGLMWGIWAMACITLIPTWRIFLCAWLPASAVLGALMSERALLTLPAALIVARLYAQGYQWIAVRLGYDPL